MQPWDGKIIKGYQAQYLDPITFVAGEIVTTGRREADFPGWIWCTNAAGKSGWVPEDFLQINGTQGTALRDYDARELTVEAGETVQVSDAVAGWVWVSTKDGQAGWVPEDTVGQREK